MFTSVGTWTHDNTHDRQVFTNWSTRGRQYEWVLELLSLKLETVNIKIIEDLNSMGPHTRKPIKQWTIIITISWQLSLWFSLNRWRYQPTKVGFCMFNTYLVFFSVCSMIVTTLPFSSISMKLFMHSRPVITFTPALCCVRMGDSALKQWQKMVK